MEDPVVQTSKDAVPRLSGVRAPRINARRKVKASSPKDSTPIVANGLIVERETIPPIVVSDPRDDDPTVHINTEEFNIKASSPIVSVSSPSAVVSPKRRPVKRRTPPIINVLPRASSVPVTPVGSSTPTEQPQKKQPQKEESDKEEVAQEPVIYSSVPNVPKIDIPDYSSMSRQEQAQHRANFRTRFGILRQAWENYHIPDVPDHLSLEEIHAQYDTYVRHIRIKEGADKYKVYLVIGWLLIELFCTKVGLNIGGYTISQMKSMNKYQTLLIELGEKNFTTASMGAESEWSVELRLIFMALGNAIVFVVVKMISSFIGEQAANTIVDGVTSYLSGSPPQPSEVLFGSEAAPPSKAPDVLGGVDLSSIIGNLGSAFISSQMKPPPSAKSQVGNDTGRFRPAYEE